MRTVVLTGLCLLFCLTPAIALAQKVLVLENPSRYKRIVFRPGDEIRFGTLDGNARYNGRIESVDDSVVVIVKVVRVENEGDATNNVFRDYVPIREIDVVYNGNRNWWYYFRNAYAGTAMIGGGILLGGITLNGILENQRPEPFALIFSASLSASGLLLRYAGRNKYRIGNRWQLRAMEPMVTQEELKAAQEQQNK